MKAKNTLININQKKTIFADDRCINIMYRKTKVLLNFGKNIIDSYIDTKRLFSFLVKSYLYNAKGNFSLFIYFHKKRENNNV